jgi:2-methylisocitrate lyase-like PEP mutase family enzyme
VPVVINARTDVFLLQIGNPSERLEHAIRRLNAYRRAGADCLFAPGVRDRETIATLVRALEGPLNILAGPATPAMEDLERLGVARISFGSWPMRASYGLFLRFAQELRNSGTYAALGDLAIPYDAMNKLFTG